MHSVVVAEVWEVRSVRPVATRVQAAPRAPQRQMPAVTLPPFCRVRPLPAATTGDAHAGVEHRPPLTAVDQPDAAPAGGGRDKSSSWMSWLVAAIRSAEIPSAPELACVTAEPPGATATAGTGRTGI